MVCKTSVTLRLIHVACLLSRPSDIDYMGLATKLTATLRPMCCKQPYMNVQCSVQCI